MVGHGGSAVLTSLRGRRDQQLAMLELLVGIDSQWSNPAGVGLKADLVGRWLSERGFEVRTVPQAGVDPELRWAFELLGPGLQPEDLAGTRIASRAGRGAGEGWPPVLLLVDVDTAFRGGPRSETPFRVDADRVLGTGVADMQAGIAVMLEAIAAVDRFLEDCPALEIVLSCDEMAGSPGSRHVIAEVAARCPVTLCMECARDGGNLMHSRAHIGLGLLSVRGRESHAGTDRARGISAVRALAPLLLAVDDLVDDESMATVTMLSGGRRRSVVPGEARAVLDLRARDPDAWSRLVARLEDVVAASESEDRVTLRTYAHRPGFRAGSATRGLLGLVRDAAVELTVAPPGAVGSDAAGSSAFAAAAGSTVLDGLGAPGGRLMTPHEYVTTDGLAERAALLALLVGRVTAPTGLRGGSTTTDDAGKYVV